MTVYNRVKIERKSFTPAGNDGTITGASWSNDHRFGEYALSFDGTDDFVNIAHNANQLFTTGFTISAWAKPTTIGETNGRILDKSTSVTAGDGYALYMDTDNKVSLLVNGGTVRSSANNSVPFNVWTQVLVTVASDATVTFYINGVASGTPGTTGALSGITTTNALRIGNRSGATDRTFDGVIDEVMIYNRALTATEADANYDDQNNPTLPNLISWWRFNEGTGSTAEDGDIVYYRLRAEQIAVHCRLGQTNNSGTFQIRFDNRNGTLSNRMDVGSEVTIYSSTTNPPTTALLLGRIGEIDFDTRPNRETLTISGRDYTGVLQDLTVEPEVYNNAEVSAIVEDLIDKYGEDITTTNVQVTGMTSPRKVFLHRSLFDCIRELAEDSGFYFFVNTSKDLNFIPVGSTDSGLTFDNSNVIEGGISQSDDELVNSIYVYGDRVLVGQKQTFTADGAGSVYTLTYRPHNTTVNVSGINYSGGIFEMADPVSNEWEYLVDFDNRRIILTSGTAAGNNLAASGVSVVVDYFRRVPIIKYAEDTSSIQRYGRRNKVIINKEIRNPTQAVAVARTELSELSEPTLEIKINLDNITSVTPGQLATVNLPFQNINSQKYTIIEANYVFDEESIESNNVLRISLSKKKKDIIDSLKQALIDLRKIQASDIDTDEVITRVQVGAGSFGVKVKEWTVSSRALRASFILGHAVNGQLGSPEVAVNGSQVILGDQRGGLTVQVSGGD